MKTTISVTITENADGNIEFYFINNDTGDTCKKTYNFEEMDNGSLLEASMSITYALIDSFRNKKERS